jgi:adenylyl-sulfate kinase
MKKNKNDTKAVTIWLTGLSGSGKTTLANAMAEKFRFGDRPPYIIDGDVLRTGLCADLKFSDQDRSENIRRAAELAKILNSAGIWVIAALISPFEKDRKNAGNIIGNNNFFEVYISTPMKVCEARDVKGLYAAARNGHIKEFTGISSPYQPPLDSVLEINTATVALEDSVEKIFKGLDGFIALAPKSI